MAKSAGKQRLIIISTIALILISFFTALYFSYKNFEKDKYKKEFNAYVDKYSSEYDVDPLLVYTVILTESSFVPEAESDVGARGLMQIMPDTYEWIKYRLDDSSESFDDMYLPEVNIKYGTYLVSILLEEFESVDVMAAAYHAGRTKVNNWLKDEDISQDGKTLDIIPISQTSHYVKKIVKNYDKYKEYYEQ